MYETSLSICKLILTDNSISKKEMAEKIGVSTTTIQNHINKLKTLGILIRIGADKNGYWQIVK